MQRKPSYTTIDEYIAEFPKEIQTVLRKLRATIKKTIPDADELISYQIPAFKLNGRMVIYFAGWKHHVAMYPIPAGSETFNKQIVKYKKSKGTLHFPLDQPLPLRLIQQVVKYRVLDNAMREQLKIPKPKIALPPKLGAPAERALANAGIKNLQHLARFTEDHIANLHGFGPNALGKLRIALKANGLMFKK